MNLRSLLLGLLRCGSQLSRYKHWFRSRTRCVSMNARNLRSESLACCDQIVRPSWRQAPSSLCELNINTEVCVRCRNIVHRCWAMWWRLSPVDLGQVMTFLMRDFHRNLLCLDIAVSRILAISARGREWMLAEKRNNFKAPFRFSVFSVG